MTTLRRRSLRIILRKTRAIHSGAIVPASYKWRDNPDEFIGAFEIGRVAKTIYVERTSNASGNFLVSGRKIPRDGDMAVERRNNVASHVLIGVRPNPSG